MTQTQKYQSSQKQTHKDYIPELYESVDDADNERLRYLLVFLRALDVGLSWWLFFEEKI